MRTIKRKPSLIFIKSLTKTLNAMNKKCFLFYDQNKLDTLKKPCAPFISGDRRIHTAVTETAKELCTCKRGDSCLYPRNVYQFM